MSVDSSILPVVSFWEGVLDPLRLACLRSQLAAGHRVTLYSFKPIAGLPHGIDNADAGNVLPRDFAKKIRPQPADDAWSARTTVQFSDFFRMALMRLGLGLWLDADVLLLKPVTTAGTKPFLNWASRRRLNNAVLYLPQDNPIVTAYAAFMQQDDLVPEWLSLQHRANFFWHRLIGRSERLGDMRIAIFGPAALTALARRTGQIGQPLPIKAFHSVHAKPELFFDPTDFQELIDDPEIGGFHISTKDRSRETPIPGSLNAWAQERFGG